MITNIVKEIEFTTPEELINWLNFGPLTKSYYHESFIFRGDSNSENELLPSALRVNNIDFIKRFFENNSGNSKISEDEQIRGEFKLLEIFYNLCNYNGINIPNIPLLSNYLSCSRTHSQLYNITEKWVPEMYWEIFGIAQHYGLPTRLLDWTTNKNIALFFSIQNNQNKSSENAAIWVLFTYPFDFMKSLTYKHQNLGIIDKNYKYEIPLKIIRPNYSTNQNMIAQKGLFTLWEINRHDINNSNPVNREPLDKMILSSFSNSKVSGNISEINNPEYLMYKLIFNRRIFSEKISNYLFQNGIKGSTVFPTLDGIVNYIKNSSSKIL